MDKKSESLIPRSTSYLNDDELKELLKRENLSEVKSILYNNYYSLVSSIVSKYAKRAPHLRDDLFSVGLLALARSLSRLEKRAHDNITATVSVRVHGALRDFVLQERNKLMSDNTIRRRKGEGEIHLANETDCRISIKSRSSRHSRFNIVDEYDELNYIIEQDSRLERQVLKKNIIKLRAKGHTDEEVGEILNVHVDTVRKIRHEIMNKRQKLNNY